MLWFRIPLNLALANRGFPLKKELPTWTQVNRVVEPKFDVWYNEKINPKTMLLFGFTNFFFFFFFKKKKKKSYVTV